LDLRVKVTCSTAERLVFYKGEQVPILGGGRITGMAGKWDIGSWICKPGPFDHQIVHKTVFLQKISAF